MVTAVILAGGRGKRVGSSISKQYIEVNRKPILYYTINQFMNNVLVDKIVLVLPEDEIAYCQNKVIDKYNLNVNKIVCGGKERSDSVYNALSVINKTDIVLIHDGARPFVSQKIINDSIKYAKKYKAAAPGVMPKDTIKVKSEENFSLETPNRNNLVAIQTPQAFEFNLIYNSHIEIKKHDISVTDDTMVVEYFNKKVYIFDGEYENIKVTTPEDLILAEYISSKFQ